MGYVTGVLFNMLSVLFAPFAEVFRGSDVAVSLSPGLAWMNITLLLWACGQTGHSYMVACCIAATAFNL
jgi:hypothetical protein